MASSRFRRGTKCNVRDCYLDRTGDDGLCDKHRQLGSTFNMEDLRKALGSAQSTPTAAAAATPSAQRHDASAHAPALQAANSERSGTDYELGAAAAASSAAAEHVGGAVSAPATAISVPAPASHHPAAPLAPVILPAAVGSLHWWLARLERLNAEQPELDPANLTLLRDIVMDRVALTCANEQPKLSSLAMSLQAVMLAWTRKCIRISCPIVHEWIRDAIGDVMDHLSVACASDATELLTQALKLSAVEGAPVQELTVSLCDTLRRAKNALEEHEAAREAAAREAAAREAAAREAAARDCTVYVAPTLFRTFDPATVSGELNAAALRDMLQTPTAPIPFSVDAELASTGFFRPPSSEGVAHNLGNHLACALRASLPYEGSEMDWSHVYARYFNDVAIDAGLAAFGDKGGQSTTHKKLRRDLYVCPSRSMHDVECIVGEFKSTDSELAVPVHELSEKHVGSTAAQYGGLRYILAVAAAGPLVQFFALPVEYDGKATHKGRLELTDVQDLNLMKDRIYVLRASVNMARWVQTVKQLLPEARPPMDARFLRPNVDVYGGNAVVSVVSTPYIHVAKVIQCPAGRLRPLLQVYKIVNRIATTGCCVRYSMFGIPEDLLSNDEVAEELLSTKVAQLGTDEACVRLRVTPVGYRAKPSTCEELRHAIICVLTVLEKAHAENLCHRDLRWPNVLKQSSLNWLVIDWEMAHIVGEDDADMVGQLIRCKVGVADAQLMELASDLDSYRIDDAAAALARLRVPAGEPEGM